MEFRRRCLCMRMGFLFVMLWLILGLACEQSSISASQETETNPNSEADAAEKAPASAPPVKPKEITFELVKSIKFADGTEVKSITKADIEALRDLPIDMGGNDTDGVTLTKSRDDKVHVRTCREYDAALEDGYYPMSTYDISMGSWFKYPCETLNLLEIATIPEQSFIPTLKEGAVDLELLPFSLFPELLDFEDNIENVTYRDRVKQGLLKVTDIGQNWFSCEDDGLRQHLTEVARADFNSDGIEDILLSEAVHATQGTYRTYDLIILTRKSTDGKYEKVELPDPE